MAILKSVYPCNHVLLDLVLKESIIFFFLKYKFPAPVMCWLPFKNVPIVTALALSIFPRDFLGMGVVEEPVILWLKTHTNKFQVKEKKTNKQT